MWVQATYFVVMALLASSPKRQRPTQLRVELAALPSLLIDRAASPLVSGHSCSPSWLTSLGVAVHHWVFRKPNRRTPASGFIYSVSCINTIAVCLWMQMESTWSKQMHKSAFLLKRHLNNNQAFLYPSVLSTTQN